MIPVFAAGVVGICLGATVTALWSRGRPVVPLAKVRAWKEDLLRDWHEAHVQAVDAHDTVNVLAAQRDELRAAMFVLAQELSDERREHAATKLRADTAEGHLRDLRDASAVQQFAEEDAGLDLEPAA